MNLYKIYCGGEFVTASTEHPVKNKYSNKVFAKTYLADKNLLDNAIKAAEKARPVCKELTSQQKYNSLKFISEELEKNKNRLAEILCIESGKPLVYAITEIERSVQTFYVTPWVQNLCASSDLPHLGSWDLL